MSFAHATICLHCAQDVYLRTHISVLSKGKNDRCQMFIRCFYSILLLFEFRVAVKRWVLSGAPNVFCSRPFFVHTHEQYIHYTYHSKAYNPRVKTWGPKGRSDTPSWFYKCLKYELLAKTSNFGSWNMVNRDNNSRSDTFETIYIARS